MRYATLPMAEKRRLPVLQDRAPAPEPPADDAPPPWHWVPIGAVVSIATGMALARSFYMPWMQRQLERVYGTVASPEAYARADARLTTDARDALMLRLSLAGLAVALVSVAVGGLVVGRFGGGRTNA